MSTNRSVDRSAVTPKVDRSAVTHKVDRTAVIHKVERSAITHKVDRSAVTHKNDRSGLCAFTFADGRRCRTPRRSGHPHLCAFHAQKEALSRAAEQAGEDVSYYLSGTYLSACDLTAALGRIFSAAVYGEIKPKTATALAYLGQTLNQSIQLAQHEYINAFGTNSWSREVRSSVNANIDHDASPPQSDDAPAPDPPAFPSTASE